MQWKLESRMISYLMSRRRSIWNQRKGRTEKNAEKVGLNLKRRQGSNSSGRKKVAVEGKEKGWVRFSDFWRRREIKLQFFFEIRIPI